jgi:hypothetical protein
MEESATLSACNICPAKQEKGKGKNGSQSNERSSRQTQHASKMLQPNNEHDLRISTSSFSFVLPFEEKNLWCRSKNFLAAKKEKRQVLKEFFFSFVKEKNHTLVIGPLP